MLTGKRTYIVALMMVVYNGIGLYLNQIGMGGVEMADAMNGILTALGLAGLRAAAPKAP